MPEFFYSVHCQDIDAQLRVALDMATEPLSDGDNSIIDGLQNPKRKPSPIGSQ